MLRREIYIVELNVVPPNVKKTIHLKIVAMEVQRKRERVKMVLLRVDRPAHKISGP